MNPRLQQWIKAWTRTRLEWACRITMGAVLIAAILACSGTGGKETLTVFAAASLTQAFTEVGDAFEEQHPEYSIRLAFDGSQRLRVQLDHGAVADLFASADERQMDLAKESGLLVSEAVAFATNSLVVAVSSRAGAHVDSLIDLAGDNVKLVLAHPEAPAGRYALAVIDLLAKSLDFGPGYSARLLENVVSQEPNVRGVLQKVALGEADAGFVYASDASTAENVSTLPLPEQANIAAIYPVAVLRTAVNKMAAEEFIQFLISPRSQSILQDHGFGPVPSKAGSKSRRLAGAHRES